ncbi:uncharacterized protein LOC113400997 isoform X1 [Vanessa tameamea]|uniref:Uncharacterized protein LOC113400997 isoform X1 n=1 Tax=Vanessa tameamea TaxID=334116 RepID=A0A8B8IJE2_VANTA|nr:uncharacterized protein LOC113400997 isoform X1 [Vanessa tameamea]
MEEIRSKQRSIQNAAHHIALECIHPQSTHGSPYHVHPYPSPVRLQHAFQAQQSPQMFYPKGLKPHIDSRAFATPSDSPILGRALCLTPRGSPLPGRVSHLNEKFQDSLTLNSDTDALVAKISAMFPTVSETHIKILLKKYYNREAVVISALQVEKHPITTPGPLTMSPSATRLQKGAMGVYSALQLAKGVSGSMHSSNHLTPMTGTPHGSPLLLRPASGASSYYVTVKSMDGPVQSAPRHQSPKMKLKYLKSVFPKAEETLILDVLANKDNNVQKASEELITMGFTKKETLINQQKKKEKETPPPPKKVVIMKTLEEKKELKQKLQKRYDKVAERVVSIALESVDFNEERAEQILNAVVQEEDTPKMTRPVELKDMRRPEIVDMKKGACVSPVEPARPTAAPVVRRLKTWTEHLKPILKSSTNVESKHKSQYTVETSGPNASLRQGPKDSLLLEDYMTWNGPNPELRCGPIVKADGPEQKEKTFSLARGSLGLARGPAGLAKGSIYQKVNKKSAKIIV